MCKCGCNACETKKPTLMLNENKAPLGILSNDIQHHINTNTPLNEHKFRVGSTKYFNLWAEARYMYSRGILEVEDEKDLSILKETDLGHFGTFEGKKVPLDFPILESMDYDEVAQSEFGLDYDQLGSGEKEWVRDEIDNMSINESETKYPSFEVDRNIKYQDTVITKGYWVYTDRESGGKGVYRNIMNDQMLGFSSDDFDVFRKHLSSHFDIGESLNEDYSMLIGKRIEVDQYNILKNQKELVDGKVTGATKDTVTFEVGGKSKTVSNTVFQSILKNSLNEASKVQQLRNLQLLRQTKLSADEYQMAKKLKPFNKDNYKWDASEGLYVKSLNEDISNAKFRLAKVLKYLDIEYKKTGGGEKYVQINYIPVTSPQSQNPEWVNVRYEDEKELQKIGKALKLKLKESVIAESAKRDYKKSLNESYKVYTKGSKSAHLYPNMNIIKIK